MVDLTTGCLNFQAFPRTQHSHVFGTGSKWSACKWFLVPHCGAFVTACNAKRATQVTQCANQRETVRTKDQMWYSTHQCSNMAMENHHTFRSPGNAAKQGRTGILTHKCIPDMFATRCDWSQNSVEHAACSLGIFANVSWWISNFYSFLSFWFSLRFPCVGFVMICWWNMRAARDHKGQTGPARGLLRTSIQAKKPGGSISKLDPLARCVFTRVAVAQSERFARSQVCGKEYHMLHRITSWSPSNSQIFGIIMSYVSF